MDAELERLSDHLEDLDEAIDVLIKHAYTEIAAELSCLVEDISYVKEVTGL